MPTKLALELRKKPLKKIFECTDLVDKEVAAFKEWFVKMHGYSVEDAKSKPEVAKALYAYCKQNIPIEDAHELPNKKGTIVPYSAETIKKSGAFFGGTIPIGMLHTILIKREGQCVAFASLYCAIAEEIGLNAKPFEVDRRCLKKISKAPTSSEHVVPAFLLSEGKYVLFDTSLEKANAKYKGKVKEKEYLLAVSCHNVGAALASLGNYEEAIKFYDRALEIDPELSAAWNNKGFVFYVRGNYEEAIKFYDRALEIDPTFVNALYFKVIALVKLGRRKEAEHCYAKIDEIKNRTT